MRTIVIQAVGEVTASPNTGGAGDSAALATNLMIASAAGPDAVASAKKSVLKNMAANTVRVRAAGRTAAVPASYQRGEFLRSE